MIEKRRCPVCGSEDTKVLKLPTGTDEYLFCNNLQCGKITVVTKVTLNDGNN